MRCTCASPRTMKWFTRSRRIDPFCRRVCCNVDPDQVSAAKADDDKGIEQVSDRIWLVTFMDYDLGYFDDETCRLEPLENPFGPKVLPMSPV
jgi:putative transposase